MIILKIIYLFLFSNIYSQIVNIEKFKTEKKAFEFFDKKFKDDLSESKIEKFLSEERAGKIKLVFGKYLASKEKDLNIIFSKCGFKLNSKECWYGALSEYSSHSKDHSTLLNMFKTLPCYSQKLTPSNFVNFCDHAVGHSMYAFYKHDLEKSVKGCKDFFPMSKNKKSCITGVLNHHFLVRECTLGDQRNGLKESYKCEGEMAYHCFKFKFNGCLEKIVGDNFAVDNVCQLKEELRNSCYKGMGASVYFKKFKNGLLSLKNVCSLNKASDMENCFLGFFDSMATDGVERKKLSNICNQLKNKKIYNFCLEKSN